MVTKYSKITIFSFWNILFKIGDLFLTEKKVLGFISFNYLNLLGYFKITFYCILASNLPIIK